LLPYQSILLNHLFNQTTDYAISLEKGIKSGGETPTHSWHAHKHN